MTPIEFLNNALSGFFLAASQNPWLQAVLGLWLLLALFNRDHRKKLVNNIAYFLRMPLTYDDDVKDAQPEEPSVEEVPALNVLQKRIIEVEAKVTRLQQRVSDLMIGNPDHENQPLYPRRWFEDASKGLKNRLAAPFSEIEKAIKKMMTNTGKDLTWDSTLGSLLLAGFIYADIIGGINIISLVPGVIDWDVPVWLREYSITIIAGTILSVFVSAWMHGSMSDKKNDDEARDNETANNKNVRTKDEKTSVENSTINPTRKIITRFLLISSLATIIGINLLKLPVFIDIFSEEAERVIELTSGFFLHVMVMFNAALATYLLDAVGRKGLVLFALPILFPLYIISWVTHFLLSLLASLGPVAVDIVVRIVFVTMNIVVFYVIAPIDLGGSFLFKNSQAKQIES